MAALTANNAYDSLDDWVQLERAAVEQTNKDNEVSAHLFPRRR